MIDRAFWISWYDVVEQDRDEFGRMVQFYDGVPSDATIATAVKEFHDEVAGRHLHKDQR